MEMLHKEHKELGDYQKFMSKAVLDKAVNTLIGIVQGMAFDNEISSAEANELINWCTLHREFKTKYPFYEIFAIVDDVLKNNILTNEQIKHILFFTDEIFMNSEYYNSLTCSLQILQGIFHGIVSDNNVSDNEITALLSWLGDNSHLEGLYPYDEICSLLNNILSDGIVTSDEREKLMVFFSEFIDTTQSFNLNEVQLDKLKQKYNIVGVCAVNPNIIFKDKLFCFTGISHRASRNEISKIIINNGGLFNNRVVTLTDYLIVGNGGNPTYTYTCYGRKIEQAVQKRKDGGKILIINEIDFWNTLNENQE